MRRWKILVLFAAPVICVCGYAAWGIAGLPPVRMLWTYAVYHEGGPTGRTVEVEGIELVEIGRGCFKMGSEQNAEEGDWLGQICASVGLPFGDQPQSSNEMPVHWVEFRGGFWIARMEVTNAQCEEIGQDHEWVYLRTRRFPARNLTHESARAFCRRLAGITGLPIRLPTEAEWEASCRAGTRTEYCFGDDEEGLAEFSPPRRTYISDWDSPFTCPVGVSQANPWGLHDFHGNVGEWCEDSFHESYRGAPSDGSAWISPDGDDDPRESTPRVIRGGKGPGSKPDEVRSASRYSRREDNPSYYGGFRLAFTLPSPD